MILEIIKVKDSAEGGKVAFDLLKEQMDKGIKVLGLATGSTPETFYKEIRNSDLDFSNMVSINLDEYVGLSSSDENSYRYYMDQHLFNYKPFAETHVPHGDADDLKKECDRYNQVIADNPIDFQILGIGRNGHIGFNEPGSSFDLKTRVVDLTPSTIEANKIYFDSEKEMPKQALSMGIASILQSKQIVLMAYGEEKADAVKKAVNSEVTEEVPATVLQKHDDVTIIVDEEAGKYL